MKQRFAILAILSLFCLLGTASASVVGLLNTGSGGTITVSDAAITWNPDPTSIPSGVPCGTALPATVACNSEVATGTTLAFSGGPLGVGEGVLINHGAALTPGPFISGGDNFLQFAAHPLLDFKIVDVLIPSGPGAPSPCTAGMSVGQSCVLFPGSPVLLTLLSGNRTSATVNFDGVAGDGGSLGSFNSSWIGGFSATLTGTTPFSLETLFCPGGVCSTTSTPSVSTSFSGTFFVTVTPEPGSFLLIGGGLIGLAGLFRRKKSS